MELGDKLKSLRTARQMTMEDLAKQAGTTSAYIAMIETGKRQNVSDDILERLGQALRINPDFFRIKGASLPMDCLPDLPKDIIDLILNAGSMPYLKLTEKAMKNGVSPQTLEKLIDIFIEGVEKQKRLK